jgi:hypothetical protein
MAEMMRTHSYALHTRCADKERIAVLTRELLAIARANSEHNAPWILRSGGQEQYRVALLQGAGVAERRDELLQLWRAATAAATTAAGLPTDGLHLVDLKLMASSTGVGEQKVHWDATKGANGDQRYSFLLYCTPTLSTAVPVFDNIASLSTPHLPQHQRRTLFHLLSKRHFHSVPVCAGELLVMRQSVPHYGVCNASEEERVVLFDMMSESTDIMQDDYTHYAEQYIMEAESEQARSHPQAARSRCHGAHHCGYTGQETDSDPRTQVRGIDR